MSRALVKREEGALTGCQAGGTIGSREHWRFPKPSFAPMAMLDRAFRAVAIEKATLSP